MADLDKDLQQKWQAALKSKDSQMAGIFSYLRAKIAQTRSQEKFPDKTYFEYKALAMHRESSRELWNSLHDENGKPKSAVTNLERLKKEIDTLNDILPAPCTIAEFSTAADEVIDRLNNDREISYWRVADVMDELKNKFSGRIKEVTAYDIVKLKVESQDGEKQ